MQKEIILKKIDNQFIGVIPYLGISVKAESAEKVYTELNEKSVLIEKEWAAAGLSHLLKNEDTHIKVIKLEKRFKQFILLTVGIYFIGLIALGLTVQNSVRRITDGWSISSKEQSPEKKEKNLQRFKVTLEKYKPYILEVKKVLNEKDSDENR